MPRRSAPARRPAAKVAAKAKGQAPRWAALERMVPTLVHEVRNNLASLSMALDLADYRLRACDPEHLLLQNEVRPTLLRTNGMLQDLLDLVRQPPVPCAVIDVAAVVGQLAQAPPTGTREGRHVPVVQLRLGAAAHQPAGALAYGNARAFAAALGHVLCNAYEALPEQHGEVRLELAGSRRGWQVHVLDDGPGVAHELRRRLYHPFVGTKRRHLGVGLTLASRYMRAQSGTIALTQHAARRFGRGASFCLTLPYAPSA